MGPCTASSCCCQAPNLPWAPVPPPHAAARSSVSWVPVRPPIAAVSIATLCHVPLSGLLTLLCVPFFVIGCWQITGLPCCCQAPNLPWAPVPPPHAAARSRVSHGSLYGLPLLLSPSPHSAMCHFQVSSHTAGVFHFLS
ncbi:unnamed protein product [Staurois parvus]|uniref:Uncharacterized protein n=1 Tax=Staurois parvus TaxID=386267 RepID=A0ABN9BVN1_9NEOB|nr:unnamed protein product [Staurois parvus]